MEIRFAKQGEEVQIMTLIRELAAYENALDEVVNTPEKLAKDLFDEEYCEALVAVLDGEIIGFALFYTSYSTWRGPCIYLEDLYVKDQYRRFKAGSRLFESIVQIAKDRGYKRMDWQVLEWNEPAIKFYEHKKATLDAAWLNGRLFLE